MAIISGTSSDNTLQGTSEDDTIYGLSGSDRLYGNGGNDTLIGGTGTNTLFGGAGNDIFKMSERFDYFTTKRLDIVADLQTGDKIDVSAYGISSFDQLKLIFETKNGTDAYFNAYYYGYENAVQITKVAASRLSASNFIFDTRNGNDQTGTQNNDRLFGSASGDTLDGAGGADQLLGGNGNDTLMGGTGTNSLFGGAGNDIFKMSERFDYFTTKRLDIVADLQTGDKIDVSAYGISSFDQLKLIFETKNGTDAYFNAYYYGYENAVQITKVAASRLSASNFIFDTRNGNDQTGTQNNDRLFGSASGDTLDGAGGADQLLGGNGNDTLMGGTGTNSLFGGAGNDIFKMSERFDYFTTKRLDIVADLQTGDKIDVSAYGISSFDQLKLIFETKNGTDAYFNAYYYGYENAVQITKVAASKLAASNFVFDTRDGNDQTGTQNNDRLFGSASGDTLDGAGGADQLLGGNGNDTLMGGTGTNSLFGGAGNDIFKMSERFDYFTTKRLDIVADLQTGDKIDVSAYGISSFDQLKLIFETKNGTDAYFNAYYYGYENAVQITKVAASKLAASNFVFDTRDGNDQTGTQNNDRLFGSVSGDTLDGAGGADQLLGGNGNDTLMGGTGTNSLFGGAGNDIFKMSERFDYFTTKRLDIVADLQTGDKIDVSAYGISSFDQLKLIFETKNGTDAYFNAYYYGYENAVQITKVAASKLSASNFIFDTTSNKDETGTKDQDTLFGSTSGDTLYGIAGNDRLLGGGGNDVLTGGAGADQLFGGAGNDVFSFTSLSDSIANAYGRDTIFDFVKGDKIDVSAIDANTATGWDDRFSFIGTQAFSNRAGQLRYDRQSSDTYIYADTNGDGKADLAIQLDDAVTLTKSDFNL